MDREPAGTRRSGDPAHPRARAVDRRPPRLPEDRDRGAVRHHARTTRRRPRPRVDDRRARRTRPATTSTWRRTTTGTSRSGSPTTSDVRCGSRRPRVSRSSRRVTRCSPFPVPTRRGRSRRRSPNSRTRWRSPDLVVNVGDPGQLEAIRDAVAAPPAGGDRVLVGRPRRGDDPSHRPGGGVLRDRGVVRRRVLPSGPRRADVPCRPDPFGDAHRTRRSSPARPDSRPATSTPPAPTTPG